MNRSDLTSPAAIKRLIACLAGSFVLALMWGPQEGVQEDYGYAFRQAIFGPRIWCSSASACSCSSRSRSGPWSGRISFGPALHPLGSERSRWWPRTPCCAGTTRSGKFGAVSPAVANTAGISPIASAFFGWLALDGVHRHLLARWRRHRARDRRLAWIAAALCIVAGVIVIIAHQEVVSKGGGVDHSLGSVRRGVRIPAHGSGVRSRGPDSPAGRGYPRQHRPLHGTGARACPLAVAGFVATLIAMTYAAWFSPQRLERQVPRSTYAFHRIRARTNSNAVPGLARLGAACRGTITAVVASYLRRRALAWVAATLGVVGVVLTLITLYRISKIGADNNVDAAAGPWQNLGSGGWLACLGFSLLATAGFIAATANRSAVPSRRPSVASHEGYLGRSEPPPVHDQDGAHGRHRGRAVLSADGDAEFWQQVLVSEIGVVCSARRRPERRGRLGRPARPRVSSRSTPSARTPRRTWSVRCR